MQNPRRFLTALLFPRRREKNKQPSTVPSATASPSDVHSDPPSRSLSPTISPSAEPTAELPSAITAVAVKSTLVLNDVVLPASRDEQEAMVTSLEDGIRSIVSAGLSDGNTVREVNILTINGQTLEEMAASFPEEGLGLFGEGIIFRRLGSPKRALQSSMDVTFDVVVENVCRESCKVLGPSCECTAAAEGLGDDVLAEVQVGVGCGTSNSEAISLTFRMSKTRNFHRRA